MKKIYFSLVIICLTISSSYSQVGYAGLQFLKYGVSTRSLGMGDVSSSFGFDAAAAYDNPALLSTDDHSSIQISHKTWFADTKVEFLGLKTVAKNFSYSLFLNSTLIPDIPIRTIPGPATGMFDVHYFATGISTARKFSNDFSLGIGVKILYEKFFVDDATGLALDFGMRKVLENNLSLGASVSNVGSMSKLRNAATTIPTTVRIGGSFPIVFSENKSELLFALDAVDILPEKAMHIHSGFEFTYDKILSLRFGIQTGYEAKKFFSTGLGITYNNIIFDYAFVPTESSFEPGHTIGVGYIFE